MDQIQFNEIIHIAKKLQYSSLNYVEYEDINHFSIIIKSDSIILLYTTEGDYSQIHYAANDIQVLISNINSNKLTGLIKFVPYESIREFELIGFKVHCAYQDYYLQDISNAKSLNDSNSSILLATKVDSEQLSKISQTCLVSNRGFWGETSEWFEEWLTTNDVIVVHQENQIVGFCCVSVYGEGTILWIREIAVHADYQGIGLGRDLLDLGLKYGRMKGAKKSFLAVDIDNKKAIQLYESFGFTAKENEIEVQMLKK